MNNQSQRIDGILNPNVKMSYETSSMNLNSPKADFCHQPLQESPEFYQSKGSHIYNTIGFRPALYSNFRDHSSNYEPNRTVGRKASQTSRNYTNSAPDSASFHLIKQKLFEKPASPFEGDTSEFLVYSL